MWVFKPLSYNYGEFPRHDVWGTSNESAGSARHWFLDQRDFTHSRMEQGFIKVGDKLAHGRSCFHNSIRGGGL